MNRSIEHLPISILEQCFNDMLDETLSQVERVSKRFYLATRPVRCQILQCIAQHQDKLDQTLKRVTQVVSAQNASSANASPFRKVEALLDESDYTDVEIHEYSAKSKARTETVVQILQANNGVAKLELIIRVRSHPDRDCHPDLLAAIRTMCAAARRDDTAIFLTIAGSIVSDSSALKLDAKISSIIACFPENSVKTLNLHDLHLDDLKTALGPNPALNWLNTLRLRDCQLSSNGLRSLISFPYLDKLVIDDSDVPSGLICASSTSLRKLIIDSQSGTSPSGPLPADFANLEALSISRDCNQQHTLELQLMQSDHVKMHGLRILRIAVDDASTLQPSLASVVLRLPSLQKLEFIENSEGRLFSEEDEETEYLGYLALVKACSQRQVNLSVALLSKACVNPQNLAKELQRLAVFQSRLCLYQLDLQFRAIREMPLMLEEAVQLPELNRLSISLLPFEDDGTNEPPQDGWENNLLAVLSQLSAPKCEDLNLRIAVGQKTWKSVARLLEGIASRAPGCWPALKRIGGYCSIDGPSSDEDEDGDERAELIAAVSLIGTQCRIDFGEFSVYRYRW